MRPVPGDSRLVTLREALESKRRHYCIITHNVTDLLDIKDRPEPGLIVLHSTIEGRIEEEKSNLNPETMRGMLHKYIKLVNCHAVATCTCKGKSWGLTEEIVTFGIDADEYLTYSGEIACGLRICNFIESRKKILLWDFNQEAFAGIPLRLVGHNPGMPGVAAAESWDHLKRILQSHRFYIHTADARFEAGYNMACVEAIAAGLPVPGNQHYLRGQTRRERLSQRRPQRIAKVRGNAAGKQRFSGLYGKTSPRNGQKVFPAEQVQKKFSTVHRDRSLQMGKRGTRPECSGRPNSAANSRKIGPWGQKIDWPAIA